MARCERKGFNEKAERLGDGKKTAKRALTVRWKTVGKPLREEGSPLTKPMEQPLSEPVGGIEGHWNEKTRCVNIVPPHSAQSNNIHARKSVFPAFMNFYENVLKKMYGLSQYSLAILRHIYIILINVMD